MTAFIDEQLLATGKIRWKDTARNYVLSKEEQKLRGFWQTDIKNVTRSFNSSEYGTTNDWKPCRLIPPYKRHAQLAKNIMKFIENFGKNSRVGVPDSALKTAFLDEFCDETLLNHHLVWLLKQGKLKLTQKQDFVYFLLHHETVNTNNR